MHFKPGIHEKDHGWNALMKRVKDLATLRSRVAKVGVLSSEEAGEGGLTLAELAVVLHFGTHDGHIPARPFLQMAFDQKREELKALGGKLMGQVILGLMDLDQALNIMGATLANAAKRIITDGSGVPPPNAPSTIAAKGSDRPLVDTGRLFNAITWSVGEEKESEHGH